MAMRLDQVKRTVRLTSLSDEMPFDAASLHRSAQDKVSRGDHTAEETTGHKTTINRAQPIDQSGTTGHNVLADGDQSGTTTGHNRAQREISVVSNQINRAQSGTTCLPMAINRAQQPGTTGHKSNLYPIQMTFVPGWKSSCARLMM